MKRGGTVVLPAVLILVLVVGLSSSQYVPLYTHLSLTGNYTRMVASWFSKAQPQGAIVKYGLSTNHYTLKSSGQSKTYNKQSGWVSEVVITSLQPCSKYYYVVGQGDDAENGVNSNWSPEYTFSTECPKDSAPWRIPVFGDMGLSENYGFKTSKWTQDRLQELAFNKTIDFYFHVGDISYANDRESYFYDEVWNDWFQEMSKMHPYYPYMICPGNHDYESGFPVLSYSEWFNLYNSRFLMPWNESSSSAKSNMWYSFNYKNVHFISISTETDYSDSEFGQHFGDQLAWLINDLKQANLTENRSVRPWIIVNGHRPLYSSVNQIYIQWYIPPLQRFVEDLFEQYQVDIYFAGHVHSYERSYPVYKGKSEYKDYNNRKHVVTIVTGAAGCLEGMTGDYANPSPEWSANHNDKHTGYGLLEVVNNTQLTWKFFKSEDNSILDSFEMNKSH